MYGMNGSRKKIRIICLIGCALLACLLLAMLLKQKTGPLPGSTGSGLPGSEAGTKEAESTVFSPEAGTETEAEVSEAETSSVPDESTEVPSEEESRSPAETREGFTEEAPELDFLEGLELPAYDGRAYVSLNGGLPFFDTEAVRPDAYEKYYPQDGLGRCTQADAVAGPETMPKEKRGDIGSVKPSGWHTDRYPKELVDGEALYNRCHLLAFALTGENANERNLVTGTRYMNTAGMNAFENMTVDMIRETGLHVRCRVTPIWTGENLVCDGVIMEGWSVEDHGEAICYCVFAYNVQPGIVIDYATGDNRISDEDDPAPEESTEAPLPTLAEDFEGDFVLNIKKKTVHRPDCEGALNMSEKNRKEYSGSYNQLIREGYLPCGSCRPEE